MVTKEEQYKEQLRHKFRLEATRRKEQESEQAMMEELAEFVLRFGERYDVLLDIKVKPRKHKRETNEEN